MAQLWVILRPQSTTGSFATHRQPNLFNRLKILGLRPCRTVCAGVRHSSPINADVVLITESEDLLSGELQAIVRDDGVQDPKAMDDVKEEQHGLLELDCGDR